MTRGELPVVPGKRLSKQDPEKMRKDMVRRKGLSLISGGDRTRFQGSGMSREV
ncbi:hypothetical protein LFML04_2359 [Leptospirillum ferriphilum ML-04]|uniref:Uncharacterized protein n=1 Tax=Leptospirillum ferriphilum (strain ML-04) TaxID=1048260 RepID=J9ZDP8_LEPFM|nr:hypothetical protein LFML04_2359 [Leptospirillum ferriphilum ML-04]